MYLLQVLFFTVAALSLYTTHATTSALPGVAVARGEAKIDAAQTECGGLGAACSVNADCCTNFAFCEKESQTCFAL